MTKKLEVIMTRSENAVNATLFATLTCSDCAKQNRDVSKSGWIGVRTGDRAVDTSDLAARVASKHAGSAEAYCKCFVLPIKQLGHFTISDACWLREPDCNKRLCGHQGTKPDKQCQRFSSHSLQFDGMNAENCQGGYKLGYRWRESHSGTRQQGACLSLRSPCG